MKYTIYRSGSTIYSKNETTGYVVSGTDASTVIQNTLNSLTPGRTWKENVTIEGSYILLKTLLVPSYTIIEINGILIEGSSSADLIDISGSTNVEIRGGVLDGNKTNIPDGKYSEAQRGIKINNSSSYIIVENIELKNFWWGALSVQGNSTKVFVSKCYAHDCSGNLASFFVNNASYVDFVQCYAANTLNVGFWSTNASFVNFVECTGYSCGNGFSCDPPSEKLTYIGCKAYGCDLSFDLSGGNRTTINGCMSSSTKYEGIYIRDANEPIVIGCHIENSNTSGVSGHPGLIIGGATGCTRGIVSGNIVKNTHNNNGIHIYNSQKIVVSNNMCFDDQPSKTQLYGIGISGTSDYCLIVNNTIADNLKGGALIESGTNHVISSNIGYTNTTPPTPPPPTPLGGCSPACTSTQLCLVGTCIEKKYVTYGGIAFGALFVLSILK